MKRWEITAWSLGVVPWAVVEYRPGLLGRLLGLNRRPRMARMAGDGWRWWNGMAYGPQVPWALEAALSAGLARERMRRGETERAQVQARGGAA